MKKSLLLGLVTALAAASLQAQVYTVPAGYLTLGIKPSVNGSVFAVTQMSAPLQFAATIVGQPSGRISSVAAAGLSNAAAGWSPSALAAPATPYFLKITSGAAAGRIFLIAANTAADLTLNTQGLDLTTLGIVTGANGDTYEIFPGYTLSSLFGTPATGVVGGTSEQFSASQTDKVVINDPSGVARFYYYDTSVGQWRRPGSASPQNNVVISPFAGMSYYRISTAPLSLVFTGSVPSTLARTLVPTSGTALLASYFPRATTLSALGLAGLATWRKSTDPGVALDTTDRVLTEDAAGVVRSYYFDGANWKRPGSGASQDAIAIAPGTAIYTTRFGSGASDTWVRPLPYSLQE